MELKQFFFNLSKIVCIAFTIFLWLNNVLARNPIRQWIQADNFILTSTSGATGSSFTSTTGSQNESTTLSTAPSSKATKNKKWWDYFKDIKNDTQPKKPPSGFLRYLTEFPFRNFRTAMQPQNNTAINYFASFFMQNISSYLVKPPLVEINPKCSLPPLRNISEEDCKLHGTAFTGRRRSRPAKIAHMIQLGFDVDVLEIHLREIYDVVDYFFILESTRTHQKNRRKPLIWEMIRNQERFAPFQDKVVHLIIDDSNITPNLKRGFLFLEQLQESKRWDYFLQWNEGTGLFQDDDIVGFGDADEVASRDNLQLLKYCEITDPVDIGLWFPLGLVTQALKTDFPVGGNPYTYGDPTFWTLKSAKQAKGFPTRMRGKTGKYLQGGMHMSSPGYLPYVLLKEFSCTECKLGVQIIDIILKFIEYGDVLEMEKYFGSLMSQEFSNRIDKLEIAMPILGDGYYVPWFYQCNKDRYPYWEGKHDTRLD